MTSRQARSKSGEGWPADKVKRRKVADLVPYARNARTHSDEQVAQIAASIREWGWTNPVLVDEDGGIIAGHGRILAAQMLGLEYVPCMVAAGWTEAQKRAYVIADNKLALNAGWDLDMLSAEFGALAEANFDLSLIGFGELELADLMADKTAGLTDPDDVPEVQDEAVSVRGDTWLLGKHRLRCGDATDTDDVAMLLAGVKPHLMVTDPPYGVSYDASWRQTGWTGAQSTGKVSNDDRSDWRDAWALFPGEVVYCWAPPGPNQFDFYAGLTECGFEVRMQIIWAKQHFPIGRGNYHVQHEPCWYAVRKGKTAHWSGSRKETTLWQIANTSAFGGKKDDARTNHSTQKPVECMRRPIVNNSSPGQAVYDPFLGSGTTLIAAEMEGRCAYGMELHPPYVDVTIRRWQDFTGQEAKLEGDGRIFSDIEAERCKAAA